MTKLCSGQARNAMKMKIKWGNNSKICTRELWFLCNVLNKFSTFMHIKFEDVQAVDDKVICQTSRKYCKDFNVMEITHRQYDVAL